MNVTVTDFKKQAAGVKWATMNIEPNHWRYSIDFISDFNARWQWEFDFDADGLMFALMFT